jgi:4,5-DOPA dioxygenase extradiol
MHKQLPSLFLGHGNPMNAVQTNRYTKAWQHLGETLPRPRAILAVSAHWFVSNSAVTVSTAPRTIHDFDGFPDALYQVQYPAPGSPELAERVRDLLAPVDVALDNSWGLDHGTWSVLKHVYPAADVPIVQLSINATRPAAFHYELGRALAPLRDEGVLIMGSGNVVHNLGRYDWSGKNATAYAWANEFEQQAKALITDGNHQALIDYHRLGENAALSVPTPEHYLPLLYVLGSGSTTDKASFPVDGIEGGSISMLAVQLDGAAQVNR